MFFIYNGYDHIFYLYYTWMIEMYNDRSLEIFKYELSLPDQPSWKNIDLSGIIEYCNTISDAFDIKRYPNSLSLYANAHKSSFVKNISKSGIPNSLCLYKYARGSSLKNCLEKKWMILHSRDNDVSLRILSHVLLRGEYGIWNKYDKSNI
jgi:hypothetical protein